MKEHVNSPAVGAMKLVGSLFTGLSVIALLTRSGYTDGGLMLFFLGLGVVLLVIASVAQSTLDEEVEKER